MKKLDNLKELIDNIIEYTKTWSITETEWFYNVDATRKPSNSKDKVISQEEFERAVREELLYDIVYDNGKELSRQLGIDLSNYGAEDIPFKNASKDIIKQIKAVIKGFEVKEPEYTIKDQVYEKMYSTLHDFWYAYYKCYGGNVNLIDNFISTALRNGVQGAEELLDDCRIAFDKIQEVYRTKHNLTEEDMEQVMNDHFGDYAFMYNDIEYVEDLDAIWDVCNLYLDYVNNDMTGQELLNLLES